MKDSRMLPSKHVNYHVAQSHWAADHAQRLHEIYDVDPEGESREFRHYVKVIYKYRWVLLSCSLIFAMFALIYAYTTTPYYRASAKLRISTYEPTLTATRIEDMLQEKSRESSYLETQLEELRSFSLADRVLQQADVHQIFAAAPLPGLFRQAWKSIFGSSATDKIQVDTEHSYRSPVALLSQYLGLITIRPIRRTSLVIVDAVHPNANYAALIANRHSQTYIEWVRDSRVEQQSRGLKFLRAQSEELRQKVGDLEREIADYAEANSIVALNKDENITVQKMSQLNNLLTEATAKKIEAENLYKEAEASLNSPSSGFDDQSTQSIRSELAKLEAAHGELAEKFMPSYPRMQQLSGQINALRESLQRARRQIVMGLKAKFLAAQQEESSLREALEQQKSQTYELSKRQVQYNVLNRELTSSRDLLENVLKQIKETSLAVENNSSNVSIVDLATTPSAPAYPNKRLTLIFGVLLGLGFGLAMAFFLDYLDNTIRTPEDLVETLRIPSLGVVPSFSVILSAEQSQAQDSLTRESHEFKDLESLEDLRSSNSSRRLEGQQEDDSRALIKSSRTDLYGIPIVYLRDPKSLAAEAYRTIRTAILLSQAGEPPRTILVSSAQSSEGKTTSSINLAASLASAGGRVVLLDADLRRPSVHKHFGLSPGSAGLVEVVTGQTDVASVKLEGLIKRVTLITSGRIPPNPAELLGSLEMATLLDQLASEYDYVLIDSPPVLPVTDSVILSRYVDGVVLVVRGASTPRKVVKDAYSRLQAVGARVLGAVLNDVDITGGDYYYYNRYYHSYYADNSHRKISRGAGGEA